MRYQMKIIVLRSTKVVTRIEGLKDFEEDEIDTEPMFKRIQETENLLEYLTGFRYHINMEPLPGPSLSEMDRDLQAERDSRGNR